MPDHTANDRSPEDALGQGPPDGAAFSVADGLGDAPEEPTADMIETYPRAKYDDAMEGRTTVTDFVEDLLRHAQAQLPARIRRDLRAAPSQ